MREVSGNTNTNRSAPSIDKAKAVFESHSLNIPLFDNKLSGSERYKVNIKKGSSENTDIPESETISQEQLLLKIEEETKLEALAPFITKQPLNLNVTRTEIATVLLSFKFLADLGKRVGADLSGISFSFVKVTKGEFNRLIRRIVTRIIPCILKGSTATPIKNAIDVAVPRNSVYSWIGIAAVYDRKIVHHSLNYSLKNSIGEQKAKVVELMLSSLQGILKYICSRNTGASRSGAMFKRPIYEVSRSIQALTSGQLLVSGTEREKACDLITKYYCSYSDFIFNCHSSLIYDSRQRGCLLSIVTRNLYALKELYDTAQALTTLVGKSPGELLLEYTDGQRLSFKTLTSIAIKGTSEITEKLYSMSTLGSASNKVGVGDNFDTYGVVDHINTLFDFVEVTPADVVIPDEPPTKISKTSVMNNLKDMIQSRNLVSFDESSPWTSIQSRQAVHRPGRLSASSRSRMTGIEFDSYGPHVMDLLTQRNLPEVIPDTITTSATNQLQEMQDQIENSIRDSLRVPPDFTYRQAVGASAASVLNEDIMRSMMSAYPSLQSTQPNITSAFNYATNQIDLTIDIPVPAGVELHIDRDSDVPLDTPVTVSIREDDLD